MKGRVCLFAKTPALGKVKTRLESSLGQEGCLALHKWLVESRMQLVVPNEQDSFDSAIEPSDAYEFQLHVTDPVSDPYWQSFMRVSNSVSIHRQIDGSLGDRMKHVSAQSDHYSWSIFIGADCPDLDISYLHRAIEYLNNGDDLVIGPAGDGGYVLLGFKTHMPELFQSIDWGTGLVLSQTLSVLKRKKASVSNDMNLTHSELDSLRDLDLPDDLHYYSEKYPELEALVLSVNSSTLSSKIS